MAAKVPVLLLLAAALAGAAAESDPESDPARYLIRSAALPRGYGRPAVAAPVSSIAPRLSSLAYPVYVGAPAAASSYRVSYGGGGGRRSPYSNMAVSASSLTPKVSRKRDVVIYSSQEAYGGTKRSFGYPYTMETSASSFTPKVNRKRDVVIFNSPETSYQYDTGSPLGGHAVVVGQSAAAGKDGGATVEAPPASPKLSKASDALSENRIKVVSDSLYTYKVVKPAKKHAPFFVGTAKRPVAAAAPKAAAPATTTRVVRAGKPSRVVVSSPKRQATYGAYFATRPGVTAAAAGKPYLRPRTYPAPAPAAPYHRLPPPPPSAANTVRAAYHPTHHRRPASYGVTIAPSYSRYPSSLTANTLVRAAPAPATPRPAAAAPAPLQSYSSLVRSRAGKKRAGVRPAFFSGEGTSSPAKTATSVRKAKKKTFVQRVQPGTVSPSLGSIKFSKQGGGGGGGGLIGKGGGSPFPEKKRKKTMGKNKKKEPTVIKPFSTTNFKPIDSLMAFVGDSYKANDNSDEESNSSSSSEEEEDDDDYDEDGHSLGGLIMKLQQDKDYDDGGGGRDVRYDYMYEVSGKGDEFGHSRIESREGEKIRGQYKVQLPDGRTQVVDYTADENGFHPTITYEGEATDAPAAEEAAAGSQAYSVQEMKENKE